MSGLEYWSNVVRSAGWKSLRAWAKGAGYSPQTVYCAIRVWGLRNEQPHGGMNRQIMAALRELDRKHAA